MARGRAECPRTQESALAALLRRAGMTSTDLLTELRRTSPWSHLTVEELVAIGAGAPCGPGLLRAWVAICGGDADDEVSAWVERGWAMADARQLVRVLPHASQPGGVDASSTAARDASVQVLGDACAGCRKPVPARRRGGTRPGERRWCSTECRQAGHRLASRATSAHASLSSRSVTDRDSGAEASSTSSEVTPTEASSTSSNTTPTEAGDDLPGVFDLGAEAARRTPAAFARWLLSAATGDAAYISEG